MAKKQQAGILEQIITTIFKAIWMGLVWIFKKIFNLETRSKKLDKIANLQKWLEIEKILDSGDEIHARHAIVEADKFFDDIMKQLGTSGETFADRLKKLENRMNNHIYQKVWNAHKIRNQISHELDYKLSIMETKQTIENFRSGLNDLGVI